MAYILYVFRLTSSGLSSLCTKSTWLWLSVRLFISIDFWNHLGLHVYSIYVLFLWTPLSIKQTYIKIMLCAALSSDFWSFTWTIFSDWVIYLWSPQTAFLLIVLLYACYLYLFTCSGNIAMSDDVRVVKNNTTGATVEA